MRQGVPRGTNGSSVKRLTLFLKQLSFSFYERLWTVTIYDFITYIQFIKRE